MINPIQINCNNAYCYHPLKQRIINKSDSVTFTGLSEYVKNNPNIKEAVNFGYELYKNPNVEPEKIIKNYTDEVEIVNFEGCRNTEEAFLDLNFSKDFKPINIKIHTIKKPKSNLKQHKMAYALNLAHEYTHYKRVTSPKENEFIKRLAGYDFEYLTMLIPVGDRVFCDLDMEKLDFTKKIFNFVDILNEKLFKAPIPRKKSFKREDVLASQNMRTKKQFKKHIIKLFDKAFEDTISSITSHDKDIDPVIIKKTEKILSQKGGLEKLKADVKKYCMYNASNEKEAHATECMLARKILNTNHQINYDSYVIYYSMLENALR